MSAETKIKAVKIMDVRLKRPPPVVVFTCVYPSGKSVQIETELPQASYLREQLDKLDMSGKDGE